MSNNPSPQPSKPPQSDEELGEVSVDSLQDAPMMMTAEEIANSLQVSVRTIWRLKAKGDLPKSVKVGRAVSSEKSIQCYTGEVRARIYILSFMTGLRRSELASLTAESFDLEAEQPTLTVEAGASKHRRKDVLPLHSEIVPLVREWIADLEPEEPLFPKLAKRRTWLMVMNDLEQAGIPYETKEGIADFHAAGRHSHITGLLKSGVSVAHAMALARHSDVRMTMRYTHLGIDEQANALKSLPGICQDIVRKPGVFSLPDMSSGVSQRHQEDAGRDNVSADNTSPCDTSKQQKAPPVTGGAEWRRRESKEQTRLRKGIATQELTNTPTSLAGNWQETDGTQWLDLSSVDTTLCTIIEAWDSLPKHIRDAISTLCDAQRTE